MKVLLLGGTGAMGVHLTNILCSQGNRVVVTSRSYKKSNELIEYRQGNAKDIVFLSKILEEEWDVIVDFMVYSSEEFKSRVNLLLESTHQYIFLSSARVYDNTDVITEKSNRLLDSSEDNEFLSTDEYALSKARQENILVASQRKNWTIVRPYITYSEIRLQLATLEKEKWLYRALKGRSIVICEQFREHFTTLTYGLDVSNGIANLINNPKAYGEIYHITNNSSYRWEEVLNIYLDVIEETLGKRPKVVYQDLNDFLQWNPGKYQIIYDRLFNRKFDNTKINQFINTNEFMELEDGLKKCLSEFLNCPKFNYINWKEEAIKDRYVKEKASLKEIQSFKQKLIYVLYRYIIKTNKK